MRLGLGLGMRQRRLLGPAVATLASVGMPSSVRWSGAQTATLTGTGFDGSTVAYLGGVALATTLVNATTVTAVVPRTYLWWPGSLAFTAKNATTAESVARVVSVTQPSWLHLEVYPGAPNNVLNGAEIVTLVDQSGKGDANRNATQSVATKRPTRVAANDAAYNGRATATVTGSAAQFLRTGAWTAPPVQPTRHYYVGECAAGAAAHIMFDGLAAGVPRHLFYKNNATTVGLGAGSFPISTDWNGEGKNVVAVEFNGVASRIAKSAKTFGANLAAGADSITGMTIGSGNDGGLPQTGIFAHLLTADASMVTAAIHGEIQDALGAYYGSLIAA